MPALGHELTVADDGFWQTGRSKQNAKGQAPIKAVHHFDGSRLGCDVSILLMDTRNGRIRAQNPVQSAVPAVAAQIDRIAARMAEY
ncbi:hypothetical protein VARIO8X_70047 [Burkholderiales bacterium 8X]|nr:hypothetical protein VARIO8X_70047 [Burkholderiales bacterium 8X]